MTADKSIYQTFVWLKPLCKMLSGYNKECSMKLDRKGFIGIEGLLILTLLISGWNEERRVKQGSS